MPQDKSKSDYGISEEAIFEFVSGKLTDGETGEVIYFNGNSVTVVNDQAYEERFEFSFLIPILIFMLIGFAGYFLLV